MSIILKDDIQAVDRINAGQYGVIYRTNDKINDIKVVKKTILFDKDNFINTSALVEIDVYLQLNNHENIVKFMGIYNDTTSTNIFLEEMECDLKTWVLNNDKGIRLKYLDDFINSISSAIYHIHSNLLIHNDLSPGNILISDGKFKICDFGFSGNSYRIIEQGNLGGTLYYRAPESLASNQSHTKHLEKMDVWSFGIIILYYLTQKNIIYGNNESELLTKIKYYINPNTLSMEQFIALIKNDTLNVSLNIEFILRSNQLDDDVNDNTITLLCDMLNVNYIFRLSSKDIIKIRNNKHKIMPPKLCDYPVTYDNIFNDEIKDIWNYLNIWAVDGKLVILTFELILRYLSIKQNTSEFNKKIMIPVFLTIIERYFTLNRVFNTTSTTKPLINPNVYRYQIAGLSQSDFGKIGIEILSTVGFRIINPRLDLEKSKLLTPYINCNCFYFKSGNLYEFFKMANNDIREAYERRMSCMLNNETPYVINYINNAFTLEQRKFTISSLINFLANHYKKLNNRTFHLTIWLFDNYLNILHLNNTSNFLNYEAIFREENAFPVGKAIIFSCLQIANELCDQQDRKINDYHINNHFKLPNNPCELFGNIRQDILSKLNLENNILAFDYTRFIVQTSEVIFKNTLRYILEIMIIDGRILLNNHKQIYLTILSYYLSIDILSKLNIKINNSKPDMFGYTRVDVRDEMINVISIIEKYHKDPILGCPNEILDYFKF